MEEFLSALNEEQLRPVLDTEGAVLVTAGAGSGKTRLLTHRIAHIVKGLNVAPYNILAITFTNKAAREMRERLDAMIPMAEQLWVSTFHSMCVIMLRRYIELIGYSRNFSIYDENERKAVIKHIANAIDPDGDDLAGRISEAVGEIKNSGISLDEYMVTRNPSGFSDVARGIEAYEQEMKRNNALDFDDLLVKAYEVLSGFPEALEYYQRRFKYIHVDEFQDTNIIQYRLVRLLAKGSGNVLVVGDEDQSIYGWRGANIGNIKDFIRDFDPRVYKLEQNYRSTKNILELANTVIKNNFSRIEKQLWTENGRGEVPVLYQAQTDNDEADRVMQAVRGLYDTGLKYNNMAVLMRVNSLSRAIEQKFMFYGIPYRLYGGFKFYERKEIKDLLAYVKLLVNPSDNEAVQRALAFPKKGIGETSVRTMLEIASRHGVSLLDVVRSAGGGENVDWHNRGADRDADLAAELPSALRPKLSAFYHKLTLLSAYRQGSVSVLFKFLYKQLDLDGVFSSKSDEDEARRLNVRELISSVTQTEQQNPDMTLEDYIQQIALYSDLDRETSDDCVNIATIHSAKGLEYDTVFLIGLEEGLFPLSRAALNPAELEEERRLMYVAVTRAKKRLFLSHTHSRFLYGKITPSMPSRFLKEMNLIYSAPKKSPAQSFSQSPQFTPKPSQPAFLNKLPQSAVKASELCVGQKISHKRLGKGVVKSVDTHGNQADIEFESIGVVTLALAFAPITIEG